MPFTQDPKKRLCCAVYEPQALSGLTDDIVKLGQTAGDVAAFALANGDDGALKEALAVCDVVVEATGEIRKTIAAQTAKVRAAMMA